MLLKVLVAALCVGLSQQALNLKNEELTEQDAIDCTKGSGVQLQELQQLEQDPEVKTWEPSHEMKCFFKCTAEKLKIICPDGTVNKTRLVEIVGKDRSENECMKNPPKIVECDDLDKLEECLS